MLASLLLGTCGGVYGSGGVPAALQGQLITHLASTASGAAAAAVPRPGASAFCMLRLAEFPIGRAAA